MVDGCIYHFTEAQRIFWLNWTEIQFKIIHGNQLDGSISGFAFVLMYITS